MDDEPIQAIMVENSKQVSPAYRLSDVLKLYFCILKMGLLWNYYYWHYNSNYCPAEDDGLILYFMSV